MLETALGCLFIVQIIRCLTATGVYVGHRVRKPLRFSLCGHRHVQGECQKVVRNRNNSSKKLFLSYWTGVKIDDFYVSLSGEMLNEYRQLLERIASGDVKALGILYIPYAGRVRDFATACFRTSRGRRTRLMICLLRSETPVRASVGGFAQVLPVQYGVHNAVLNFIKRKGLRDRYCKASANNEPLRTQDLPRYSRRADDKSQDSPSTTSPAPSLN